MLKISFRKYKIYFSENTYIIYLCHADAVVKLPDAIYVFEFKFDGTPEEAMAQIESKQYALPYETDGRKIVKAGVNFDSATHTIGKWLVR